MTNSAPSRFPPRDLWLPVLPLLPLVTLTIVLSSLIDPVDRLGFLNLENLTYVAQPGRNFIHLGDMLIFYPLVAFHVLICGFVICYFVFLMRSLPERERSGSKIFLVINLILAAVFVGYLAMRTSDIVFMQLGYKAICKVILHAELPTNLAGGRCFDVPFSNLPKLTLLAWIPTFSGIATVAFAAAFAYGNASALPAIDDPEWRTAIDRRVKTLQRSVYALSLVLVSSTVAITFFVKLPTGLLADDDGLAEAFSSYTLGVSTFWGALFSLTLVATFAAPVFRLLRQAYGHDSARAATADSGTGPQSWLHEHVFASLRKQVVNVLSLLAPLMVGPLSSLFSSLAGA